MLLLFVFSYLVPKENYRRYFNFFISVMMVAALLFPLLQISEKEVAEQTKARLEEIEEKTKIRFPEETKEDFQKTYDLAFKIKEIYIRLQR